MLVKLVAAFAIAPFAHGFDIFVVGVDDLQPIYEHTYTVIK